MYARITGFLLAFALAFTGLAAAQERFGSLTGKVTDQQSAAIPGVTVTATNTQTGESRVFVTGADGTFRAPDLVPGRYTSDPLRRQDWYHRSPPPTRGPHPRCRWCS